MIDLHTHTFFSDGLLGIAELVYREKLAGYSAIAITDHVDKSNFEFVIDSVNKVKADLSKEYDIKVLSGVELTYVPPALIPRLTDLARKGGADIIVVHGESPVEDVPPGTNRAAIKACVDVLAHPGYITEEDVMLAKDNDVCLEITSRRGHCNTNKLVAARAKSAGAKLVLNNDVHKPEDIIDKTRVYDVLEQAGLTRADYENMLKNSAEIL